MILFISVALFSCHSCFARVEWILLELGGVDGRVQGNASVLSQDGRPVSRVPAVSEVISSPSETAAGRQA